MPIFLLVKNIYRSGTQCNVGDFNSCFYSVAAFGLGKDFLFKPVVGHSPYRSALDFLSISNLNFAGYTGSKNQVRNRQKIKFVQLNFSKIRSIRGKCATIT